MDSQSHPIRIRNRRWRVVFAKDMAKHYGCVGDCDPVWAKDKAIRIDPDQASIMLLDTLIHEMLHASLPDLKEEVINCLGTDIAVGVSLLVRLGLLKEMIVEDGYTREDAPGDCQGQGT